LRTPNEIEARPGIPMTSKHQLPTLARNNFVLSLLMFLFAPVTGFAQEQVREPVNATPYFAFYSQFTTNLHDALIEAGRNRNDKKPELFHSGAEQPCFDGLRSSTRVAWDEAVDYYAKIISPAGSFDRRKTILRAHLAGFDDELAGFGERFADESAHQFADIAKGFWAAAGPAYRACRWESQDMENRLWIDAIVLQLSMYENIIAERLESLYKIAWSGLPIPIDLVNTVSWSGADTVIRESGGHIQIATSYQGFEALEIVFHEASHLLMERGNPVPAALNNAAESLGLAKVPRDLWHVLMFYMTGEVVRSVLEEAGQPEYSPIIYEIYERSDWVRYQGAIDQSWPAYLNGEQTLSDATINLIEVIIHTENTED